MKFASASVLIFLSGQGIQHSVAFVPDGYQKRANFGFSGRKTTSAISAKKGSSPYDLGDMPDFSKVRKPYH